jgi:hypothetical protein
MLAPDAAFVRKERIPPDLPEEGFRHRVGPALVVEVLSPSESLSYRASEGTSVAHRRRDARGWPQLRPADAAWLRCRRTRGSNSAFSRLA